VGVCVLCASNFRGLSCHVACCRPHNSDDMIRMSIAEMVTQN
jgi:hypothetical protein